MIPFFLLFTRHDKGSESYKKYKYFVPAELSSCTLFINFCALTIMQVTIMASPLGIFPHKLQEFSPQKSSEGSTDMPKKSVIK